jgi:hypothetical protein
MGVIPSLALKTAPSVAAASTYPRLPFRYTKSFATVEVHPFHALEPEVLERFSRTPVERGGLSVIAAALSQVALRNPRRGSMAAR